MLGWVKTCELCQNSLHSFAKQTHDFPKTFCITACLSLTTGSAHLTDKLPRIRIMMLSPLARYQQDLQNKEFIADAAQHVAVEHTQRLYERLSTPVTASWLRPFLASRQTVKGLYFWGGVGRGKTYIVDSFYESLAREDKLRLHFHRFMQLVHNELNKLGNIKNPLDTVAKHIAKRTPVLCLDEFHVQDITDAMLLYGLLRTLFDQGVTLVTTSNTPPDNLYAGGLQRERFLPAIALLKEYTEVINVDGDHDYRLRALERAEIYHYPLGGQTEQLLLDNFKRIAPCNPQQNKILDINGRQVSTVCYADSIVWLDFGVLCNIPRAVSDYIELAKCFNTIFLSNVRQMDSDSDDYALRFINLVDEFYDRNVKLFVSAEVAPTELYTGKKQAFQFQRTLSRLEEMRSHAYLERPHLP